MVERRDRRGHIAGHRGSRHGPAGGARAAGQAEPRPGRGGVGGRRIEKARDPHGALLGLLGYARPYTAQLAGVGLLVIISTLMGLLGPYLFGLAIDRFIAHRDTAGLARVAVLLFLTYLTAWVTEYGEPYGVVGIAQDIVRSLRHQLFAHLQMMSLSFHDRRPPGELMSRLTNDIEAINRVISNSIIELMSNILTLVGIVLAMLALNVWLALGAFTIVPAMLLLTTIVSRRVRRGYRVVQASLGRLNATLEENISGARVVQAFGCQRAAVATFQRANIAVRDASIRAQSLAMLLPPLLMMLSNVDIAVVAGLGGWLALRDAASVGTIATFIMYARRFFRPLRSLAELYNSVQSALAGAERVFEILDQVPQVHDQPDAPDLPPIEGRVAFEHVSFSYVQGTPVLQDISLSVEAGQTVALVGPTGAGKTTMVSLLSRFYDVDQGAIRIDDHDIRQVKQDSLRQQLGIVLQDAYLFADTVVENIRYGRLDATDRECVEAARLANADQFIQRLPEGYRTQPSERASNLSQGQRQLLSIARASLADPRILILDEATSSVDTRTEARIQKALLKLMEGRTCFVIAHRLSTIRNADKVLVINEGRIIERGTHESLLARGGFYHNLYMSQFRHLEPRPEATAAAEEGHRVPPVQLDMSEVLGTCTSPPPDQERAVEAEGISEQEPLQPSSGPIESSEDLKAAEGHEADGDEGGTQGDSDDA